MFPTLKANLRDKKFNADSEVISEVQSSLRQFQEKTSLQVLKSGLNNKTLSLSSVGRYFEKKRFIFCCKYIS